jgi:hypothetical protein
MKIRRVIALVFALALLAGACGDDDGGNGRFSSGIRDSYLQGCGGQQNAEFCECTLTEIEKRFTEAEFIKFAVEQTEEPPQEFVEIAFACLGEADLGG